MKTLFILLVLSVTISNIGISQIETLADSVYNNNINIIDASDRLRKSNWKENSQNYYSSFDCNFNDVLLMQGGSIYGYNIDNGIYNFVADQNVSFESFGTIGYLSSDIPKIVAIANYDSIYYYIDSTWMFSGYLKGRNNSILVHIGCGVNSTYILGETLTYFNGTSDPIMIRESINSTAGDLVVDEDENAWILTGTEWPFSDTLRVIDSLGVSICDIPFLEPINTINAYGMTIINGKVVVAFGENNPHFPNALVPLEIDNIENTVSFGLPIVNNFDGVGVLDFASCTKTVESCSSPVNVTNVLLFEDLKFYPNPFKDFLYSSGTLDEEAILKIFDITGKEHLNIKFSNLPILDTSTFINGVYFLEVQINGTTKIFKMIKN